MDKYNSIPSSEAPETRNSFKMFTILVIIAQALSVAVVVMIGIWMGNYDYGFSWSDASKVFGYHPLFMVLGLVVLYGHSILVYRIWRNARKIYVKILHAVLHGLALVFASLGLKAVFDSHNHAAEPIPNLYSLHSWMGILTVALFAGQWLGGFLTFLLPCCSVSARTLIKPMHVYMGLVIFVLAIATSLIGITEKLFFTKKYQFLTGEAKLANAAGILLVLFGAVMMYVIILALKIQVSYIEVRRKGPADYEQK